MKTINEAIQAFLFHCQYEKKLSSKTLKAYEVDCRQFQEFLLKKKLRGNVSTIDKLIIKSYLFHLGNVKPKTLRRKVATLKAMFNFLEFEEEILINPFRKMRIQIKEPKVLPRVMTLDEVHKILQLAQSELEQLSGNRPTHKYIERTRNLAVLELMFATGMRVSELCSLKPSDIDLASGLVRILGKGNRERVIQICHEDVLSTLHIHHSNCKKEIKRRGYFFLNRRKNRLSEQSVRLMIARYSQKAGVVKHVTPHTFRHSFATLLLEQDVDIKYIQQFLGHSSITTTQIYTHVNAQKQKEILRTRHPRLSIALK